MSPNRLSLLAAFAAFTTACGPMTPQAPTKFTVKLSNVATGWKYLKSGGFDTPVGKSSPGAIGPGDRYEVTFTAGVGQRLSFANMFGASNDWFFAAAPEGIALYNNGEPVNGDVTSQVHLYNAGTEVDQEPGVGPDTGPKQSAPDQGAADPNNTVREITSPTILSDGSSFNVPAVDQMIRVTLAPTGNVREFKLTVENVSQAGTLQTSQGAVTVRISPGVFVIHTAPNALFTLGQPDRGEGIEWIAESGRISMLKDNAANASGVATGFSPLVYAVHREGKPLFTEGSSDRGQGLEQIAESGNVTRLRDALAGMLAQSTAGTTSQSILSASGVADTPMGASKAGPITPGNDFTFDIEARPGDRLSIASMFGASDDWFVGFADDGLALFDASNKPVSGDLTSSLILWDAGTEQNEEPAVGPDTGPQQASPDQGPADPDARVRKIDTSTYGVPLSKHLSLTITPN